MKKGNALTNVSAFFVITQHYRFLFLRIISFPIWNYSRRNNFRRRISMNMLIIKKDMCTKSRKHIPLTYSPKEKRLINMYIPFSQGFDCPFMCWGIS